MRIGLLFIIAIGLLGCSPRIKSSRSLFIEDTKRISKPFQVFVSQNAYNLTSNEIVLNLDFLDPNEKIKIDSGFLVVMHRSGKYWEFEGSQIVNISELQKEVNHVNDLDSRPNLEYLFSGQTNKILKGHVTQEDLNLISVKCPNSSIMALQGQSICVYWDLIELDVEVDTYFIVLRDLHNSPVDTIRSLTNFQELELNYPNLEENLLIMTIYDSDDPNRKSKDIGIILGDSPYWFETCQTESPVQAILTGLIFESEFKIREAKIFFRKATEFSDLNVFDHLNQQFLKRNSTFN